MQVNGAGAESPVLDIMRASARAVAEIVMRGWASLIPAWLIAALFRKAVEKSVLLGSFAIRAAGALDLSSNETRKETSVEAAVATFSNVRALLRGLASRLSLLPIRSPGCAGGGWRGVVQLISSPG